MFCAASLCQDNSSESSPIMRDEVGEHMAWDPRPFLHTVSLQILQIQFLSFLTEAVRFSFNICWYLMESMVPCILSISMNPKPKFTLKPLEFNCWWSYSMHHQSALIITVHTERLQTLSSFTHFVTFKTIHVLMLFSTLDYSHTIYVCTLNHIHTHTYTHSFQTPFKFSTFCYISDSS